MPRVSFAPFPSIMRLTLQLLNVTTVPFADCWPAVFHGPATVEPAGPQGEDPIYFDTKWARRFLAHASSLCPGSKGRSFP